MAGVTRHDVAPGEAGVRLDRWFARRFPGLTHARLERLLRTGQVRVDGRRARSGTRLAAGQTVRVPPLEGAAVPAGGAPAEGRSGADGEAIRSLVISDDDDVVVLNKPPGLAVQGGSGTATHIDGMLGALGGPCRPRLVHRLDRDTSGVLLIARHAAAAAALARAFRSREARKIYWALVKGVPRQRAGAVDRPLAKGAGRDGRERMTVREDAGKPAVTRYRVVATAGRKVAWLALEPVTGRTHQVRVHCAELGTPVLGDRKYGSGPFAGAARALHLHARSIEIAHPSGGILRAQAPLGAVMAESWRSFGFDPEGP